MKPIISVLIFFICCFFIPAPEEAASKNKIAVEFYLKGKLVKRYESPSWIAWQMHKDRKRLDFDGNPFEADSVSAKLITDTFSLKPF
jgi:hypothetical protein